MRNIENAIQVHNDTPWNVPQVISAFTDALFHITAADERLWYTEGDMEWLVETLDRPQTERAAIIWLLMAHASAPVEMITPAQAAVISDEAASTWRNRCAAGDVIGAEKHGKQWVMPKAVVKSYHDRKETTAASLAPHPDAISAKELMETFDCSSAEVDALAEGRGYTFEGYDDNGYWKMYMPPEPTE